MTASGYQVLARKWRPQQFRDVVGQSAVVQTLENALRAGRLAHAYCFSGIRGVGKTTAARLLAKGINCHASDGPTAEPCGQCESCREIEASRSLDVIELDAASNRGIEAMKELSEVARYAPSRDRHRVFILDEAHMLTAEASNALLKTLEEPPPWLVFILATTEPGKILPTVLSRCQHYEFRRVGQGELAAQLGRIAAAEGIAISTDALALLATAADGSVRDGQSLLDKVIAFAGETIDEQTVVDLLGLVDRVLVHRCVELLAAEDVAGVLGFVNVMVDRGVDLHQFTIDLLGHFRNLLVVRSVPDAGAILHLPASDLERLSEQAAAFEIDDLDRAFSLVASSEYRIKTADQPRYHLEVLLARLARMPRLEPISTLLQALEPGASGGGLPGGSGGVGRERGRPVPSRRAPAPRASATTANPPATPAPRTPSAAPKPTAAPAPLPPSPPAPSTPETPAMAATRTPDAPAKPAEPLPEEQPTARSPEEVPEGPPPTSRLLARIQENVAPRSPIAAQLLDRTCGMTMAGERLVLQFPASAGIFAMRLQDPKVLQLLSEAAEAALGRRAIVRVETVASPAVPTATATPKAGEDDAAPAPSSTPRAAAVNLAPVGAATLDTAAMEPATAGAAEPPASHVAASRRAGAADARALADSHPMVREFVKVLKGQVTSVEEL